jgi:hypothetical protein
MKNIATMALILNLGVAGLYAQKPVNVKITSSGTNEATAIDLQTGTVTDEVILAGDGTLGPFTYRGLHADSTSPRSSSTYSDPTQAYFVTVAGAGVFRFLDGSLLNVTITQGTGCIDLTVGVAQYTLSYKSQAERGVSRVCPGAPLR